MSDELKDQRIPIMMAPSEVRAVDEWMFASRLKSRAEAIRQLIQKGLLYDASYAVSLAANELILAFSEGEVPTEKFENWKKAVEEESKAYHAQSERLKTNIAHYATIIQNILDNPDAADEVKNKLRAALRDEDHKQR
ncbi:hypothetical protein [Methylobacterium sp. R2-1]|uniref:hypothetical protein n=1 Tax=Methylobacterium sp. R2-1 TaxID=2587064 RepID=UPI0016118426|nr:hypothetical protein [Methylobacterium sp. R2-1]MBB2963765.1 ribosomal protein S17E [Methylobacterium sp. R2-1]